MRARSLDSGPQKGFTLIEILIVISIISLLASIGLGAILFAKKKAEEALALTFVTHLSGPLDHYFQDTGKYPDMECADEENAFPALFEALFGEKPPRGRGGPGAPYMNLKRGNVAVLVEDGSWRQAEGDEIYDPGVPKYILDPWGNPYVYRQNKTRQPRPFRMRRDKADIYSMGRDGIDQTIRGKKGDDIGNW